MDEREINKTLEQAKKFLKDNRDDKFPLILKGKFIVTESGVVLPMDDTAKRELEKK